MGPAMVTVVVTRKWHLRLNDGMDARQAITLTMATEPDEERVEVLGWRETVMEPRSARFLGEEDR